MGSGSSKRSRKSNAIDWSKYQPTGNTSVDKAHAYDILRLIPSRSYNEKAQIYAHARLLDPEDLTIVVDQARHAMEGGRLGEPAQSSCFVDAERLFAEAFQLGYQDYYGGVYDDWAEAVISQGPHRKPDELYILRQKELRPRDPDDDLDEAEAAVKLGQYEKAILLRESAYSKRKDWLILYDIASCYMAWKLFADGETVKACQNAVNAIKAKKAKYEVQDYLDRKRDMNGKLDYLQSRIAAVPHYRSAITYEEQGNLEAAANSGISAFRALNGYVTADLLTRILMKANRLKECERYLREYNLTGDGPMLARLAELYFREGRFTLAREKYWDAMRDKRDKAKNAQWTAQWRECEPAKTVAIETMKKTLSNRSLPGPTLQKLALCLYFEEQHELCITTLNRAIATDPTRGQYHGDLADSLWALKRTEEALPYYRYALKLEPNSLQSLIWKTRTSWQPGPAVFWTDILKWFPDANNFAWVGGQFAYPTTAHENNLLHWQAEKAYETALLLEPNHPDAPAWKEKIAWIHKIVQDVAAERAMEAAYKDPKMVRLISNNFQQQYGYGVPGSLNQFNTAYWQGQNSTY